MSHQAVKAETIIKRRINDDLDYFYSLYGRFLNVHEEYSREHVHHRYRISFAARSHLLCGQATYAGPEGTWCCWLRKDDSKTSGQPWKQSDENPSFGLYEELEIVGERPSHELHALLSQGAYELVFLTKSHLTLIISRTGCIEVQYELVWRDADQKRIHHAYYTGLNAFEQIQQGELLDVRLFRIAKTYQYPE